MQTVKINQSFMDDLSKLSIQIFQEDLTKTQLIEKEIQDWIETFGHPLQSRFFIFLFKIIPFDETTMWQKYIFFNLRAIYVKK